MPRPKYPEPAPGVQQLTQSGVETYLRCGERLRLEREARHRYATVPMLVGSAVARGAAFDNTHKKEHGRGAPIVEIIERAAEGWKEERAESEVHASRLELSDGKDDAVAAAKEYAMRVSPRVGFGGKVLMVEEPIVAPISETLELAGTPDVIEEEGLGDVKVGKEWHEQDAQRSRQLTNYSLLSRSKFGEYPKRLWIDNLFRAKARWLAKRLWVTRGPAEHAAAVALLERVAASIKAGNYLPAPERAWWCAAAWCPFYGRQCQFTQHSGGNDGK